MSEDIRGLPEELREASGGGCTKMHPDVLAAHGNAQTAEWLQCRSICVAIMLCQPLLCGGTPRFDLSDDTLDEQCSLLLPRCPQGNAVIDMVFQQALDSFWLWVH